MRAWSVEPGDLWNLVSAKDRGESYDSEALAKRLKAAVSEVVRRQVEAGIEIPSDGEFSKASFPNYVRERLSGLEGINREPYSCPPPAFPEYAEWQRSRTNLAGLLATLPVNVGPLAWKNKQELHTALVSNTMSGDPSVMAAWEVARRLDLIRSSRKTAAPVTDQPPPSPAIPAAGAAA